MPEVKLLQEPITVIQDCENLHAAILSAKEKVEEKVGQQMGDYPWKYKIRLVAIDLVVIDCGDSYSYEYHFVAMRET